MKEVNRVKNDLICGVHGGGFITDERCIRSGWANSKKSCVNEQGEVLDEKGRTHKEVCGCIRSFGGTNFGGFTLSSPCQECGEIIQKDVGTTNHLFYERKPHVCSNEDNQYNQPFNDMNITTDNTQEEKDKNQSQQLRTEIQQLEATANRTTEQEQELKKKKAELRNLEIQNIQQPNKNDLLTWIIGGFLILMVGITVYFLGKSGKRKQ